jgi:hypothetical protein
MEVAFITVDQAIRAAEAARLSDSRAESEIRKSAASSMHTDFGIFMSHSYEDAKVIAGIKIMIEQETRLTVYVDWIDDVLLDRSRVTPQTADVLRRRMRHSRFLLYATSNASANSKWMPWELGYFDGIKPNHVGILPIVLVSGDRFNGQEYLGLYPSYELIEFAGIGKRIGRFLGPNLAETLVTEARR